MSNTGKNLKLLLMLIMTCVIVLLASGCGKEDRIYPKSISELNGLRSGNLTGGISAQVSLREFPDSEIFYSNTEADMLAGLLNNKIDFVLTDQYKAYNMVKNRDDIELLDGVLDKTPLAYAFPKNSDKAKYLKAQINEFIAKTKADGTIAKLEDEWCISLSATDNEEPLDIPTEGENGTLVMATATTTPPFSYAIKDGFGGYDIAFISLFCKEYGYGLELTGSDFSAIIPAIASGKADLAGSSLSITEERMESVDFSDPYLDCEIVALVAKEEKNVLSWDSIKESFRRTFIVEDRWKMVLDGIAVTLKIFLGATLLGTALGFGIYLLCRNGNKFFNSFFDALSWISAGLPVIVLLLVMFYLIFADSTISGEGVSTIAFSISVMLGVYSLLKTSVKSIGADQIEGAYSLGFTDIQTFFRIILPQAMEQFIPNYSSTLIATLKATSVVGYIAVRDLTRASDVIRSRTYEPFFPLLVTALIYLLLVYIIILIIRWIAKRFEPKRRTEEQVRARFNK